MVNNVKFVPQKKIMITQHFMLVVGKQRAALAAVSALSLPRVHVTGNPAEFDYFASLHEACVVFHNFQCQIHFNFEAVEANELIATIFSREQERHLNEHFSTPIALRRVWQNAFLDSAGNRLVNLLWKLRKAYERRRQGVSEWVVS